MILVLIRNVSPSYHLLGLGFYFMSQSQLCICVIAYPGRWFLNEPQSMFLEER